MPPISLPPLFHHESQGSCQGPWDEAGHRISPAAPGKPSPLLAQSWAVVPGVMSAHLSQHSQPFNFALSSSGSVLEICSLLSGST